MSESQLHWWAERWWAEDEYKRLYQSRITIEELEAKIERVKNLFDVNWGRTTGVHPAHYWLWSKGTEPLSFLFGLGSDLGMVEGSPGLRSITDGLRDPKKYESSLFELQIGALLAASGHKLVFSPQVPSGKSTDLLTEKGAEKVYIELKKLRPSQGELAVNALMTRLSIALRDLSTPPTGRFSTLHYKVALDPELLNTLGSGPNVDLHIIDGLLGAVSTEINERLEKGELEFHIPGVASFAFDLEKGLSDSVISRPVLSSGTELRRIVNQRLSKAVDQLHPAFPGIIVVQSDSVVDESLTKLIISGFFSSMAAKAEHVSAAIFLPVTYSIPGPWAMFNAFAVTNPKAKASAETVDAFRDLSEALLTRKFRTPGDGIADD